MNHTKEPLHSPEPWEYVEKHECLYDKNGNEVIDNYDYISIENAQRIVNCVNALQGIPDPSVVPELISLSNDLLEAIDSNVEHDSMDEPITRIQYIADEIGYLRALITKIKGE